MSTKVLITPILQEYSNIPSTLEVNGNTIGECLNDIIRQYPEASNWLFDQNGLLRVIVSINNKDAIALTEDGLGRTLNANDQIEILAIIGGG